MRETERDTHRVRNANEARRRQEIGPPNHPSNLTPSSSQPIQTTKKRHDPSFPRKSPGVPSPILTNRHSGTEGQPGRTAWPIFYSTVFWHNSRVRETPTTRNADDRENIVSCLDAGEGASSILLYSTLSMYLGLPSESFPTHQSAGWSGFFSQPIPHLFSSGPEQSLFPLRSLDSPARLRLYVLMYIVGCFTSGSIYAKRAWWGRGRFWGGSF